MNRLLTSLVATTRALLIAALVALPFSLPIQPAHAAATTQTTHAWLCAPPSPNGAPGPRRVINSSTATSTLPTTGVYTLNQDGCGLIAATDIGFFLSQGYYFGPSTFVLQQQAITASTTSSTSTITLPAYAYILAIVLEETAGNTVTGGVDIGDSGSATRYVSAAALTANLTLAIADAALTRVFSNGGVPIADQVLVACHTACASASINITIMYTYF